MKNILRGDVYFADLDPVNGHEQGGHRPVLVIQNDVGNQHSPTTIIVPMTTAQKPLLPTHVYLAEADGIVGGSLIMCEQIRTLDKNRLGDRLGRLSDLTMMDVDEAIRVSLHVGRGRTADDFEICLCHRCLQNFKDTNVYQVSRSWTATGIREQCDYCGVRQGWTYSLKRKNRKPMRKA